MDNGNDSVTVSDIRKMNRAELDDLATEQGMDPKEYTQAEALKEALIARAESGDTGNDTNTVDDNREYPPRSDGNDGPRANPGPDESTYLDPQKRALTVPAYMSKAGKLEAVTHDKGRRVVNVVK